MSLASDDLWESARNIHNDSSISSHSHVPSTPQRSIRTRHATCDNTQVCSVQVYKISAIRSSHIGQLHRQRRWVENIESEEATLLKEENVRDVYSAKFLTRKASLSLIVNPEHLGTYFVNLKSIPSCCQMRKTACTGICQNTKLWMGVENYLYKLLVLFIKSTNIEYCLMCLKFVSVLLSLPVLKSISSLSLPHNTKSIPSSPIRPYLPKAYIPPHYLSIQALTHLIQT